MTIVGEWNYRPIFESDLGGSYKVHTDLILVGVWLRELLRVLFAISIAAAVVPFAASEPNL